MVPSSARPLHFGSGTTSACYVGQRLFLTDPATFASGRKTMPRATRLTRQGSLHFGRMCWGKLWNGSGGREGECEPFDTVCGALHG